MIGAPIGSKLADLIPEAGSFGCVRVPDVVDLGSYVGQSSG